MFDEISKKPHNLAIKTARSPFELIEFLIRILVHLTEFWFIHISPDTQLIRVLPCI